MSWQFLGVLGVGLILAALLGGGLAISGVVKVPVVKSPIGAAALVIGGAAILGMAYLTWTERADRPPQDSVVLLVVERIMETIDNLIASGANIEPDGTQVPPGPSGRSVADISPLEGARSQQLSASGSGWIPGERIEVMVHLDVVARTNADANGSFSVVFTIPDTAFCMPTQCFLIVSGSQTVGAHDFRYLLED